MAFDVEIDRRAVSPQRAAASARRRSAGTMPRSPIARRQLQRAIALIDARFPGGPNCLRRSLIEMSLDSGAAQERLLAGFVSNGGKGSGHAWLESQPTVKSYDAVIPI